MPKTHQQTYTRLYRIWGTMRTRCMNPHCKDYKYYGGRGIRLCREWLDFDTFSAWANANGYRDDLTIERIDNGADYCPDNCRWATLVEQGANKRNNHYVEVDGERMTIGTLARRLGLTWHTVYKRWHRGADLITGKAVANAGD